MPYMVLTCCVPKSEAHSLHPSYSRYQTKSMGSQNERAPARSLRLILPIRACSAYAKGTLKIHTCILKCATRFSISSFPVSVIYFSIPGAHAQTHTHPEMSQRDSSRSRIHKDGFVGDDTAAAGVVLALHRVTKLFKKSRLHHLRVRYRGRSFKGTLLHWFPTNTVLHNIR